MNKKQHIEFELLIQDKNFINRISAGFYERDNYLKELLTNYPDKEEEILFAVQFILTTQYDKKKLCEEDIKMIWRNIQSRSEIRKIRLFRVVDFSIIFKIAALFVLIISVFVLIHNNANKISLERFANTQSEVTTPEVATILFSDGSKQEVINNNSQIEFDSSGKEIIIRKDNINIIKLKNPSPTEELVFDQVIVPFGRRHSVTLSDGTIVHLNSGSKLVFPVKFSGKFREVYLKGEGYFDVKKNPDMLFIVKTDFIDVKVMGTKFNVSAYSDEPFVSTVLAEGSLTIFPKNKLFNNPEFLLQPGQGCFYNTESNNSTIREVDLMDYLSWKDGILQFKDQPLIDIIQRVKRYYNIPILIEGDKLSKTLISGKLVMTGDIIDVMNILAKTLETRYEINEDSIFIIKE
jgi:hypothetical protein